jgi:hypothetical protein
MEIMTLVKNLPKADCVVLSKAWKHFFFIINDMVVLPFVKIFHEKRPTSKIYHKNESVLENLP